jgi:hypothetical protein
VEGDSGCRQSALEDKKGTRWGGKVGRKKVVLKEGAWNGPIDLVGERHHVIRNNPSKIFLAIEEGTQQNRFFPLT